MSRRSSTLDRLVRLRAALGLLIVCVLVAGKAQADCPTRHFYNHELVPFTLIMGKGACTIGASPMMRACTVQPDQVAEIHYGNIDWGVAVLYALNAALQPGPNAPGLHTPQLQYPGAADDVSVVSADGGRTFGLMNFVQDGDCHLIHPSDTAMLVINEPAAGDITVDCRGYCKTTRDLREMQRVGREQNAAALQRQAQSAQNFQWYSLDITLSGQHCIAITHATESVSAQCYVVYDPRRGGVYVDTTLRHPFACRGQIENVNGKLACIDLKPQCEQSFSFFRGDPMINITCPTRSTGVLANKQWSVEITRDCDTVWLDDPEKRDAYPVCTRLP